MLFKKKPHGLSVIHYAGLPGFQQDSACFIDIQDDTVTFATIDGKSVSLPISKIECVDIMPETAYMLKYHNAATTTAKIGMKWYGVITYTANEESKSITIWYMETKISNMLYALQKQCAKDAHITL